MEIGKEVYRSVKVTDNVKIAALGVPDQIRLLLSKFSNDDMADLDREKKVNEDKLRKLAALNLFIDQATNRMEQMKKHSVTISLASEFLPYLPEVADKKYGKGQYYDFEWEKRELPPTVSYKVLLRISKKER